MYFRDRTDAGRQLAKCLMSFSDSPGTIVLGIPRGGVPVAYEITSALHAPLDVFLSRKLGVPGNEELAFGAIASEGGRYLDDWTIRVAGISPEQIAHIAAQTQKLLEQRAYLFRRGRAPLNVHGKAVILADDGIATGASILAAIHALKQMKPKELIVAAPVAALSTCYRLENEVDKLVVVHAPPDFRAVGEYYADFRQVSDEEVIDILTQQNRAQQTTLPANETSRPCLEASVPKDCFAFPPKPWQS